MLTELVRMPNGHVLPLIILILIVSFQASLSSHSCRLSSGCKVKAVLSAVVGYSCRSIGWKRC